MAGKKGSDRKELLIEDARLIFRNFEGKQSQFNREGKREFSVILDPATAEKMIKDGWNVKTLKAREEGDEETPYLTVAVAYTNFPPTVISISSYTGARTTLNESTIEMLDWAEFENIDLIVSGYDWDVNGKQGTKAYLKKMYVTLVEDELDRKYATRGEEMMD